MDWARYRQLADSPRLHTRYLLERTLVALAERPGTPFASDLRCALVDALASERVPYPPDHRADPRGDLFEVRLTREQAAALVGLFAGGFEDSHQDGLGDGLGDIHQVGFGDIHQGGGLQDIHEGGVEDIHHLKDPVKARATQSIDHSARWRGFLEAWQEHYNDLSDR